MNETGESGGAGWRGGKAQLLEAALAASGAATEALMARFDTLGPGKLRSWMKSPGALVTEADVQADRVIAETLDAHGVPGDIWSEESRADRGGGGGTWLIDPLCGTVPFSTGMPHWGVNIALRLDGELELGAISIPPAKERLAAVRGGRVARNGALWSPRAVSGSLDELTVGLEIDGGVEWGRLLDDGSLNWLRRVGQANTFSSAAYPLAQLCAGRLAASVFYGVEAPVHVAAGACIARELGIESTDDRGKSIDWSSDAAIPVVVFGWPEPHGQIIDAMAATGSVS